MNIQFVVVGLVSALVALQSQPNRCAAKKSFLEKYGNA